MAEKKRLSQSDFAANVRAHHTMIAGRPGRQRAILSFHDLHDLDMSRADPRQPGPGHAEEYRVELLRGGSNGRHGY